MIRRTAHCSLLAATTIVSLQSYNQNNINIIKCEAKPESALNKHPNGLKALQVVSSGYERIDQPSKQKTEEYPNLT